MLFRSLITEYIKIKPTKGNKLFYGDKIKNYTWLNHYVKSSCEKLNLPIINPHLFRKIIAKSYVENTGNMHNTKVWLWHKITTGATINYIEPNYDKAVEEIGKYLKSLLD